MAYLSAWIRVRRTPCVVLAVPLLLALTGCDNKTPESHRVRSDAFPMGQAHASNQPPPQQPVLGAAYVRAHEVLPQAKVEVREPLPAAVPLPQPDVQHIVQQGVAQSSGESGAEQGGSNPASGMAAGITNAQGDGEKHQLDGGTSK